MSLHRRIILNADCCRNRVLTNLAANYKRKTEYSPPQYRTVTDEIETEIKAIEENRSLLAEPEPVPGLSEKLTDELRKRLMG